ncbi:MAG: DMT family transporter [Proteobacteria bacterium]|nr:DMT family transporter [Pseudomonadota bacterium]
MAARIPAPVVAALLMVAAMFLAALSNAITRYLSQEMPPLELAFFRNLFGLLFLLPILLRTGLAPLRTRRHGLYFVRGLVTTTQMAFWVYSLQLLPVDKAIALNFTVPLWATLGAALILREAVGLRRWGAVAVGVIGSLVILRPGFASYEPASILPILTAAGMAAVLLIIKDLARTESPISVVLYMGIYTAPISLLPALLVWQAPTLWQISVTAVMGVLTVSAHFMMTRSLALADASAMAPYDFFRLPFGALIGFLWFGELMDGPSWFGAFVILAGTAYLTRLEGRAAKARARS